MSSVTKYRREKCLAPFFLFFSFFLFFGRSLGRALFRGLSPLSAYVFLSIRLFLRWTHGNEAMWSSYALDTQPAGASGGEGGPEPAAAAAASSLVCGDSNLQHVSSNICLAIPANSFSLFFSLFLSLSFSLSGRRWSSFSVKE